MHSRRVRIHMKPARRLSIDLHLCPLNSHPMPLLPKGYSKAPPAHRPIRFLSSAYPAEPHRTQGRSLPPLPYPSLFPYTLTSWSSIICWDEPKIFGIAAQIINKKKAFLPSSSSCNRTASQTRPRTALDIYTKFLIIARTL